MKTVRGLLCCRLSLFIVIIERERLKLLRENVANRRRTLAMAVQLSPPPLNHLQSQESTTLSNALARARSGLVQELVEVFNVVEVGGRPPIGGKAGTKGEWTICELVLPVPGDIRRKSVSPVSILPQLMLGNELGYPPDHINAVITHTIHFLGLLAFYLGVKLPFEISWSGKKFGVGQPWIGACRGTESGNWAKSV
jgi:Vacuolar sorting 38 and autophagy-related subunit 14